MSKHFTDFMLSCTKEKNLVHKSNFYTLEQKICLNVPKLLHRYKRAWKQRYINVSQILLSGSQTFVRKTSRHKLKMSNILHIKAWKFIFIEISSISTETSNYLCQSSEILTYLHFKSNISTIIQNINTTNFSVIKI